MFISNMNLYELFSFPVPTSLSSWNPTLSSWNPTLSTCTGGWGGAIYFPKFPLGKNYSKSQPSLEQSVSLRKGARVTFEL